MKKVQTAILIFLSCILAAAGVWCVSIAVHTISEEEKIADYEKEIRSLKKKRKGSRLRSQKSRRRTSRDRFRDLRQ